MQIFTALLKGPDLESELVDGSPSRLPNIALALRLTTAKPPLNLMAKQPRSDDAIADTGYDSENLRNPTLSMTGWISIKIQAPGRKCICQT